MKFIAALTILAFTATTTVLAGPISVSGNNVGDIVTVGVNVRADVTTDIRSNIVNVLVALLTHIGDLEQVPPPEIQEQVPPHFDLLEAIHGVKALTAQPGLTKEQKAQIWKEQVEGMARKILETKQ